MSCNLKGTNLVRANRLIPIIVSVILLAVGVGSDIGDLNTDAPALKSGQPSLEKAMTMTVAPQVPVITSVDLTSEAVSEGTKITVTVRAESNSPVNWINNSFYGPHGSIYGGGNDASFTEVSPCLWEYTWRDIVSKYAPSGTYYYENISVGNAGMLSSDVWPYDLGLDVLNHVAPQAPVVTSVNLTSEVVPEGTEITVTVRAESNSPVNWINKNFYGPHGIIYGGGHGTSFTEVSPGLWEYIWRDIVSEYAPSGTYYYENISVENAGMLSSDVWSYDLGLDITNHVTPQAPVIISVDLTSEAVPGGTKITVTVRAESNSPANWINKNFYGPHGNIYGGGHGTSFTEVSPDLWEYTWRDIVSKYAPSGTYYYENISVGNAGMLSSDVWPYPLTKEIINAADTGILLGDINEDGKINVSDAILILRHIVGLTTLVGNGLIAADVNQDFEINVSDAILILRYIVGLVPSLQ